jgi:hypothetical protein
MGRLQRRSARSSRWDYVVSIAVRPNYFAVEYLGWSDRSVGSADDPESDSDRDSNVTDTDAAKSDSDCYSDVSDAHATKSDSHCYSDIADTDATKPDSDCNSDIANTDANSDSDITDTDSYTHFDSESGNSGNPLSNVCYRSDRAQSTI